MYYIYKITNNINQDFYIGYTTQNPPQKRWLRHKQSVRNKRNGKFINALRKYGVENFTFEVLCEGEDEDYGFNVLEPQYIENLKPKYNTLKGGPNIQKGGMRYLGDLTKEEISKKLSDSVKQAMTPKLRHQISISMKKFMTHEKRQQLSEKMKEAFKSEEIRQKLREP